MMFNLSAVVGRVPPTPRALLARGQKGSGFDLQVTDRALHELVSLRCGQVQQAQADRVGSIAQRAFRRQVRDFGLLACKAPDR